MITERNMQRMTILSKPLLVALAVGILVFFISDMFNKKRSEKEYTIRYTVSISPDPSSKQFFSFGKIKELLQQRLETAGYRFEMNTIDTTALNITLYNMTDTTSYRSMSTPGARLQFREVYNINELKDMLSVFIPKPKKDPAKGNIVPSSGTDTVKNNMADHLESQPVEVEDEKNDLFSLIEISSPFQGDRFFPSEIGYVKLKDTAAVMKLLLSDSALAAAPKDLQLYFGEADKKRRYATEGDQLLPIYGIRTKGSPGKAILENEDIQSAAQDLSYDGRVEIRLQFKNIGTRKWADMTRNNIGRSIAVIIDNTVIMAPRVNDMILDGNSAIAGNYSVGEAQALSFALNSPKLPAKITISSATIQADKATGDMPRKLLISGIAFIIVTCISFFLFKELKAR